MQHRTSRLVRWCSFLFLVARQDIYQYNFKKAWLSDSSTYPLIASLTFCGAVVVGFTFNAFSNYKDVQISSKYKKALIRDWGEEKTTTVTEALSGLGSFHKNPKGLGTSEWTK